MVPSLWAGEIMRTFKAQNRLFDQVVETKHVLSLGQNLALTADQIFAVINDESTDPIIRDALIAYMAKIRIAPTPKDEVKIQVDTLYGYKPMKFY